MANPKRKMATIRRVTDITPIEGADRIELAHVGGWQCVVGKGEYEPGDLCVYYEIDSFMPTDDERYAFLADRGTTKMVIDGEEVVGHKLRTAKLRGVYSQGLLMKPEAVMPEGIPAYRYAEMCDEGLDVSKLVNVCEYYKPLPAMNAGFIGRYDPWVAPRTDAERAQNINQETFDLIKRTEYEVSVKVDGTSITMLFDDRINGFRAFSHNNEFGLESGMGKLVYDCAKAQGLVDFCEANHMISLQAELCGPKIQSDRLGLGKHRLFVFSVWEIEGMRYVSHEELGFYDNSKFVYDSHVPILDLDLDQFDTTNDLLEWVDGIKGNVTKGRLDEGVVVHIYGRGDLDSEEWQKLRSTLETTMQVKAVSNRFLLKAKD